MVVADIQDLASFSVRQKTVLTLLGYKRWVLRNSIGQSPRAVSVSVAEEKAENKNKDEVSGKTFSLLKTGKQVIALTETQTSLWISRDYSVLFGDSLACHWILPPLWVNNDCLVLFAEETERILWLAALEAVGLSVELSVFKNLFHINIPVNIMPEIPALPFPQEIVHQKKVVFAGLQLDILLPVNTEIYHLLHPLTVLRRVEKKRKLWQQLLILKEALH